VKYSIKIYLVIFVKEISLAFWSGLAGFSAEREVWYVTDPFGLNICEPTKAIVIKFNLYEGRRPNSR